jgi:hypothetical protein
VTWAPTAVSPSGRPVTVLALVTFALVAGGGGCARIVHRPLPAGDDDADLHATGLRYYASALYLLAYPDGRGGVVSRILELPDTTRKLLVEPRAFLARLEGTLEFRDGALRRSREEADATELPAAVIDAVEGFATTVVQGARGPPGAIRDAPEAIVPAPHLYRIEVEGDSIRFHGGAGDEPVRVSLRPNRGEGGERW